MTFCFDCTLLLQVSHWFPDMLHTVLLLLFFFLLRPAGCWGMGEMKNTVQPVSLIAIKLLWLYNTSGPPVLSVKNTEQQVRPGETRDMNSDWANFSVISYCALVCMQNVMLQSLIRVYCLCWYRKIHSNSVTHCVLLQDNTEVGKSVSVFFSQKGPMTSEGRWVFETILPG